MYFGVERPSAVFLDLNLPRVDGWQVLVAISHDEQLRSIPVAYALAAKHYVGAFWGAKYLGHSLGLGSRWRYRGRKHYRERRPVDRSTFSSLLLRTRFGVAWRVMPKRSFIGRLPLQLGPIDE